MSNKAKRKHEKKPLWRKENTCTYFTRHRSSMGKFKYERGKKESLEQKAKMRTGQQNHGIDLTPLYGFLHKNVGKKWDAVKSEALSRLPDYFRSSSEVFNGVVYDYEHYELMTESEKKHSFFRSGESSYYSELYVDQNGILQMINPNWSVNDFHPSCACCTHTLNGKQIPKHLYPKY